MPDYGRREDGAPAKLWWGPRTRKIMAMFKQVEPDELGLRNRFAVGVLPMASTVTTGIAGEMPERQYRFYVYDWYSGELVVDLELRSQMVDTVRAMITNAMNTPLEELDDPDLPG